MYKSMRDILLKAIWFPVLIFILNAIIWFLNVYEYWPPVDILMHLLGGISITYFFWKILGIIEAYKLILPLQKLIKCVLTFTLTCTITVFWEFAEFVLDHTIANNVQLGLDDTLLDMLLGIFGGILFLGGVLYFNLIRRKTNYVQQWHSHVPANAGKPVDEEDLD